MYREAAVPDPTGLPPSELVVTLGDANPRSSAALVFHLFGVPGAIVVATVTIAPVLAYAGFAAGAVYGAWQWRRRPHDRSIVLRVAARELTARAGKRFLARVRLDELDDVALDVRTIRPLVEGANIVPGMRFSGANPGPEIDVARISLVGGERSVFLNDEYIAHMTATEWLGKIRAFLRTHGWVPAQERGSD
jgi:hypothetical protein